MGLNRTLVVGASSGIGLEIARQAAELGPVVAAARRVPDIPGGVSCDITDPTACRELVANAAGQLGGIDSVIYAAGVGRLVMLEQTGEADWNEVLATNLLGAAHVVAAALPWLRNSERPVVAVLSSDSVARPLPGLGAYAVSKAALDTLVQAWRAEEPAIRFTRVIVGATLTGFASSFDPQVFAELWPAWQRRGHELATPMSVEHVARVVLQAVRDRVPEVTVQP